MWKNRTRGPSEPLAAPGEDTRARVERLRSAANKGLWALVLFILVSMWARSGFVGFPRLPTDWDALMGRPPPAAWINGVFVLYVFSAMVRSLVRMADGEASFSGFLHVGYLTAFYGFYRVAGALEDNYWAVLVGGFALLTLEAYRNRVACLRRIREELARSGEFPGSSPPKS